MSSRRLPKKISKLDKFAVEWNAMVDYLASLTPVQDTTTRTTLTLRGTIREADRQQASRGGGGDPVWL